MLICICNYPCRCGETADALDSGSSEGDLVQVQILSSAPATKNTLAVFFCCNDISVNGNDIRCTNDIANAMIFALSCK